MVCTVSWPNPIEHLWDYIAWTQWETQTDHGPSTRHRAPRFLPAGFCHSAGAHNGGPADGSWRGNHLFGTVLGTKQTRRSLSELGRWWNSWRRWGQPTATTWPRHTTTSRRWGSQRKLRSGRPAHRPTAATRHTGHHVRPRCAHCHHPHHKASWLGHQTHWSTQAHTALVLFQGGIVWGCLHGQAVGQKWHPRGY